MMKMLKFSLAAVACCFLFNVPAWAKEEVAPAPTTESKAVEIVAAVEISEAWIREAPPTATTLAAYMQITNPADEEIALTGASTAICEKVELHGTVIENDIAKMVPQKQIAIPAQQSVALEPGGLHIMLIGLKQPLKAGDKVDMTLNFSNDTAQEISVEVKKDAEGKAEDHNHHAH